MPESRRQLFASLFATVLLALAPAGRLAATVVTTADLKIVGSTLQIDKPTVTVEVGSPAVVQTRFGGKINGDAPPPGNLLVAGDLVGPGITTPVPFVTAPGQTFQITGLSQEGTYYLQNIRLVNGTSTMQLASPSLVIIQVTNALNTSVSVVQLTADQLRQRGISVDLSNYDVFEYTFTYLIDQQMVQIAYPVIINRLTHEATPLPQEQPYGIPPDTQGLPPRWTPAPVVGIELVPPSDYQPPPAPPDPNPDAPPPAQPSVHAAIVIPNSLAVLHQFFSVGLLITNASPKLTGVTIDGITATIDIPNELRIDKTDPPVANGQPVAIQGPLGAAALNPGDEGQEVWTVEGLKAGTYTINFDVHATFHSPGQPDIPLEAKPSAVVIVHDARFNLTFSHPDTINKGLQYSTYTFVTNISDSAQDIIVADQGLPACSSGGTLANVCRVDSSPSSVSLHLEAGETKSVEYKLQSSITGHVFATAASIDGSTSDITAAAFQLTMGVSETGVPLSPVTLVLPHYATTPYLSQPFLDGQLEFLGEAFGLATAPLNNTTAKFPRLITTDVFTRAVDIARAGERIFIGDDRRDSLANMTLDLMGNSVVLAEWDQFRRQEIADPGGDPARGAMTALATEVGNAYNADGTFNGMADRFAAATSDRAPYFFALAHGATNASSQSFDIKVVTAGGSILDGVSSAASGWLRQIPYGETGALVATAESGTMAVIGRATDAYDVTVTAAVSGPATLDLIIPSADGATLVRATAVYTATAQGAIHVHVANGTATSSDVTFATSPVAIAPVRLVAAHQDLFLDTAGRVVSVLFNRALPPTTADLSPQFSADVTLDPVKFPGISFTGTRPVSGAALQSDGRIIRLNFDNALSNDPQYTIHTSRLVDPSSPSTVVPVIETRDSALVYGIVIKADNTPVGGATLSLRSGVTGAEFMQYTTADSTGHFLFEYVPRDPANGFSGGYDLTADGANQETQFSGVVRLLHTVQNISVVFLGRGSAKGTVRYDDGTPVAGASVVVGSTMFGQFRTGTSNSLGVYNVTDLPVGPLTFSAQDTAGNISYAANELHGAGELLLQDISIIRKAFPGTGTVQGRVIRSDTSVPVPNTRVGVFTQGYGLKDALTDVNGRFQFTKVPSGFVTVLGQNYNVAPQSIAIDFDLKPDEARDVGDLVLAVQQDAPAVDVSGTVLIEDPIVAGKFSSVANAQVQISGMAAVSADALGVYHYYNVPQVLGGAGITAYDPATARVGSASLPRTFASSSQSLDILIPNVPTVGTGTIRVHLLDAQGLPVTNYHVFEPGYPHTDSLNMGEGVYEFQQLGAGTNLDIVAAPNGGHDGTYGYQFVTGSAGITFAGQISALTLRLPGQGTVHGEIQQQTQAGVFVRLVGQLNFTQTVWSDDEQSVIPLTRTKSTDGSTDAIFDEVQVGGNDLLETYQSLGYDSAHVILGYDGATVTKLLTLSTLASVSGHLFMPDGYTPVASASVELTDGVQDNTQLTAIDGSFLFQNVLPGSNFSIKANFTQNGIYRTAYITGNTPANGGPSNPVTIVLLKQGSVEGTVVDLSNQPIPFAKFWVREVSFPSRSFGSVSDPLITDANGHFRINNVFAVPFRVDAQDPNNAELTGSFNGVVGDEAQVAEATVVVGGAGTGSIQITVVDPNNGFAPVPNAQVSLFRTYMYDFGTTDLSGKITFVQVAAGSEFTASAYSQSLAKGGSTTSAIVVTKDQTATASIPLTFSGEINGTLDDPQSASSPVPGSSVNLFGDGYATRATTDTIGGYDFKGVRAGTVNLNARDPQSIRMARGTAAISLDNPTVTLPLHLEPTSTLTVKVFLPNDSGASSGTLAPMVEIDVTQNAPGGQYLRSSETNGDTFAGLVRGTYDVHIEGREVGGLGRTFTADTSFDANTASKEVDLVLSATGTVIAHVQQGSPAADAPNVQVTAVAHGGSALTSGFTDSNGLVTLSRLPLGNVSIQAQTLSSEPLTGAVSVTLTSSTQPVTADILLGSYGGITGMVNAEGGGPSAGTEVIAQFTGTQLETRTDVTGAYTFLGIVTPVGGTTVNLIYLAPDDNTIGAVQTVSLTNGSGVFAAPPVTLDSTPPRLLSVFPADGATKVAPDTQLKFTFNRAIRPDQLTYPYFSLFDVGGGSQLTLTLASPPQVLPDNSEIITFNAPPAPPGQRFPLKSNTLYHLAVSAGVQDLANHLLGSDLGVSFITSDYSSPQVVKADPSPKLPLPKNNFRIVITFSKPLDPAAWVSGGSGSMQLVQISGIGGTPIGSPLNGEVQLDPQTGASLYFAPDVLILESSYYRLSISGVTDTSGHGLTDASGNPLATFTQDYFSFDLTPPGIVIANPIVNGNAIGDTDPLFTSTIYRIPVTLTNASDLDRVDFFTVDASGALTPVNRSTTTSVDVALPSGTTTFTLKAVAYDLSGNSAPATRTWNVSQQAPLSIVSATITPATVYANNPLTDTVVISGGGLDETVTATATRPGNPTPLASASTSLTRAGFNAAWPAAVLPLTIPPSVPGGSAVLITETVSDVRGGNATHTSNLTLGIDTVAPSVQPLTIEVVASTVTGAPANDFNNNDQFKVHAFAKDLETGVASVTFTIDSSTYTVNAGASGSILHSDTGFWEMVSPVITVKAHNNDTFVPVTAVASDYAANTAAASTSVTYNGQHDPNAPAVTWIAPLHDAAWPAGVTFPAKLRLYATSALPLSVTFDVPTLGTVTGTRNGNEFDVVLTGLTTPAAGTPFQIVAHVNDGDGGHTADLPINIDLVAITQTVGAGQTVAVDAQHLLNGDSILVDGGRLVPHIPLALRNLIVIDGGLVNTVASTTTLGQKLSVAVTDHLYIDDTSSIDVSGLGYLGGLEQNFDQTGSNSDTHGMTSGGTTANGAANGASASYAGLGGTGSTGETGLTNSTYGSITAPTDLGSGGAADISNRRGGQGGGAALIDAGSSGKVVVAGALRADGETGLNLGGAGSGGSIHVSAAQVVLGAYATVSASGGDDDGSSLSSGGGGGRVSLEASALLDIDTTNGTRVVAYGGRNLAGDNASVLGGGAGTIFLRSPGETNGDLIVSGYDPRNPTTADSALSTVLNGSLTFDHVTVLSHGLARAEAPMTIGGATDDRTKVTTDATGAIVFAGDQPVITVISNPVAGSSIVAGANLVATYTATSYAGVSSVTTTLVPIVPSITDTPAFPTSTTVAKTLGIPVSTASGPATLSLHVTDRAGRSADAASSTYTIAANTPPVITQFDLSAAAPLYIGGSVTATISATDDLALTTLQLTSQLGAQTPVTQTFVTTAASATHAFVVAVPKDPTLDGATITFTANVQDASGAPGVSTVKTLTIAHDGGKPQAAITQPASDTVFNVGSGNVIHVVATAFDAETGVKEVTAAIEGGSTVTLSPTANANEYAGDLAVPGVSGADTVTRTITVTAVDYVANASTPTVSVQLKPLFDPAAPVVTFNCGSDNAMAISGGTAVLSVTAVPGSTGNGVSTVSFSDGTNTVTASKNGNVYTATYNLPSLPDGSVVSIVASATSLGGVTGTAGTTIIVVVPDKTITNNPAPVTINSGDGTYDNQTVVITGGTTTIIGHHEFKRLLVFNGATLVQKAADATGANPIDVQATVLYVACGGSISAMGTGYAGYQNGSGRTYPNTNTGSTPITGGSHGGQGGKLQNIVAGVAGAVYGSLWDPNEPGAAGSGDDTGSVCPTCNPGGGVIRIAATTLQLDGQILANASPTGNEGGAGGSIRLDVTTLSGTGQIHADGAYSQYAGGGGGRVAIYYAGTLGVPQANVTAYGGTGDSPDRNAAAGTVYLAQVDGSTRAKLSDQLVIDNGPANQAYPATALPDLGTGTVTAVSGNAITVSNTPSPWLVGSWIEILNADGSVLSSYQIDAINGNTVTVLLANGESAANASLGSTYRGNLEIDAVTIGPKASASAPALHGANLTLSGTIATTEIRAQNLTLSGATVRQTPSTGATTNTLQIAVAGTLSVNSASTIDATGLGYAGYQNGSGRTYPNTYTGSTPITGGSHGGQGGKLQNIVAGVAGSVYGSLWDPNEPGAAGSGDDTGSTCPTCNPGGGVIRISAATMQLDGKILAGTSATGNEGGAGGSIRLDVATLSGSGQIHADGTYSQYAGGGGGRVAIYYAGTLGVPQTNVTAYGGTSDSPDRYAAPGTVYLAQVDPTTRAKLSDGLIIDNGTNAAYPITRLLSIGSSTITGLTSSGGGSNDTIVDANAHFAAPNQLAGNRVFVNGNTSVLWTILSNTATSLTVDVAAMPLTAQVGQSYAGFYRFDSITIHNATLGAYDTIESVAPADTTHIFTNLAPPRFDPVKTAQIQIVPTSAGSANLVAGQGTVSDVAADLPINLVATNLRTLATFNATAGSDGSFTIAVAGVSGDVFSIVATDSNPLPLTSSPINVSNWPASTVIASLTITPSTVTGSGTATGTVVMSAVTFDTTVTLTSSVPATASVPASVVIPAGQTSGTFTVTTTNPSSDTTLTITAAAGSSQQTASMTVKVSSVGANVTALPIPGTGSAFARTLAIQGNILLVAGYANAQDAGTVAVFDLSDPASPGFRGTASGANSAIYDVKIANNFIYTASADLCSIDLSGVFSSGFDSSTPKNCVSGGGNLLALAPAGNYIFAARDGGAGNVRVYDVRVPTAPQFLNELSTLNGADYHGLLTYGTDYLIGLSPNSPHDVVVIDRRDVNNLVKVAEVATPGMDAFRGQILGNTLYVSGNGSGMAIVDLTNPLSPQVRSVTATTGTHGVAVAGTTVVTADGIAGVTLIDATNPASPQAGAQINVGGNAWDVAMTGGVLYVADESGLAVVSPIALPPMVQLSLITVGRNDSTTALINAAPSAVTGQAPLTVEIRNTHTGNTTTFGPNSDGTFGFVTPGLPGDLFTIKVTDGAGRVAGPFDIGTVPFASIGVGQIPISTGPARTLAADGSTLVVAGWGSEPGVSTDSLAVFDISQDTPSLRWAVSGANSDVYDVKVSGNWAYVASTSDFCTVNLSDPNAQKNCLPAAGKALSVALSGQYAFVSRDGLVGAVRVYDVTNPAAPVFVAESSTLSGADYYGLVAYGTAYLIGISPNSPHGVVVIDRHDVNNLVKVAEVNVGFAGFRGRIAGSTLYLSGNGAGWASVDLTNPLAPQVLSSTTDTAFRHGVSGAGNTVVTADGLLGVTFFDVTNPAAPVKVVTQQTGGIAWDVLQLGNLLYVANDNGLTTIPGIDAPPAIQVDAITIVNDPNQGGIFVSGNPRAVLGVPPLQVTVTDATTAVPAGVVTANSDGSFFVYPSGSVGDQLTVTVTDSANRVAGPVSIGKIPALPPTLDTAKLTTATTDLGSLGAGVILTGAPGAIGGGAPPTYVQVALGSPYYGGGYTALSGNFPVAVDGSFTATFPGRPEGVIFVNVIDSLGRTTGFTQAASIPYPAFDMSKATVVYHSATPFLELAPGFVPYSLDVSITVNRQTPLSVTLSSGTSFETALTGAHPGDSVTFRGPSYPYYQVDGSLVIPPYPLTIDPTQIAVRLGLARGAPNAILGAMPVQLQITVGGNTIPVTVAGDGSFSAAVSGRNGDSVSATATDVSGTITVPLPAYTNGRSITITPSMTDGAPFRAGSLALSSAYSTLVVGPVNDPATSHDRCLFFDLTDPTAPLFKGSMAANVNGTAYDITDVAVDDVSANAYAVAGRYLFSTYLGANPVTQDQVTSADIIDARSIAVQNGDLFALGSDTTLRHWNVSDPSNPVLAGQYNLPSVSSSILAFGSHYLVTLSGAPAGISVLDTTLPTGSALVATLALPAIPARGRISGSTLFLGANGGGEYAVDLTSPASPHLLNSSSGAPSGSASSNAVDVIGTTAYVAAGLSGVQLYDVSNPAAPASIPLPAQVGNNSFDVRISGNLAYIADDTQILLYATDEFPPSIDPSLISLLGASDVGGGLVSFTVYGVQGAVHGVVPTVLVFENGDTAPLRADGGFSIQRTASPGSSIRIQARDAAGRLSPAVMVGPVPGTASSLAISTAMSDASFRARQVVVVGNTLVVASRPDASGNYGSDKLVLFDISNPTSPVYTTTLALGHGAISGLLSANGYLYAACNSVLAQVNLKTATPAVSFIFASENTLTYGALSTIGSQIYELGVDGNGNTVMLDYEAADPANVQYVSSGYGQPVGAGPVRMLADDSGDLLYSTNGANGSSLVIDYNATNPQVILSSYPVDGIGVSGGRHFVTDPVDHQFSEVSDTTYSAPTAGAAHAMDIAGNLAIVADDAAGVTLFDISTPNAPQRAGTYAIQAGAAWDVKATRNVIYAAADTGLAVVTRAPLVPVVDASNITLSTDGVANATVTGRPNSISGQPSLTVDFATPMTTIYGTVVSYDGSFAATIPAPPGAWVTATANDGAGRSTTAALGSVPFDNGLQLFMLAPPLTTDSQAVMHRLSLDGTNLYASGYESPESPQIFVFDTTKAIDTQTPAVLDAGLNVMSFMARNGWVYAIGQNDFSTVETATGVKHLAGSGQVIMLALAVSGNYAFVSLYNNSGQTFLRIYDVTNPASPQLLRDVPWTDYVYDIQLFGANDLVLLGSNGMSVVDKSDINNLKVVGTNPSGFLAHGMIAGNRLYATAGGYLTVFDLADPANPALIANFYSGSSASGFVPTGPNEIAVAGGNGVTFIDVTDLANPVIKGTQRVPGQPFDVLAAGKTLYVAADRVLDAMQLP